MTATRLTAALAMAVVVLASCGVPVDSGPRDIEQQTSVAQPEVASTAFAGPRVYFLVTPEGQEGDKLAAVRRDVTPTPAAVVSELFKGLSSDEAKRLRTAIPNGTRLVVPPGLGSDGTLHLDVSSEFFNATGDLQIKALAQIVFTATALTGVTRVKLEVDGRDYPWPRGDGTLAPDTVTQYDYPELDPTTQPDYPPLPSPTTSTTAPPATSATPAA